MTSKEAILDMWYQKRILPSPCSRIFKKELFDTIQFKEGIIFEDVEILPKLFKKPIQLYTQKVTLWLLSS